MGQGFEREEELSSGRFDGIVSDRFARCGHRIGPGEIGETMGRRFVYVCGLWFRLLEVCQ